MAIRIAAVTTTITSVPAAPRPGPVRGRPGAWRAGCVPAGVSASPAMVRSSALDPFGTTRLRLVEPAVAVQAAEEEIPEVGEQRRPEAKHQQPRCPLAAPAADDPGVQVRAVDE